MGRSGIDGRPKPASGAKSLSIFLTSAFVVTGRFVCSFKSTKWPFWTGTL